ncbi:MAG: hypothetical protein LBG19_10625, partial [Prevotellaceae bacterium]|nr:hypothetical protein [Prevotellaceae bacterium]
MKINILYIKNGENLVSKMANFLSQKMRFPTHNVIRFLETKFSAYILFNNLIINIIIVKLETLRGGGGLQRFPKVSNMKSDRYMFETYKGSSTRNRFPQCKQ